MTLTMLIREWHTEGKKPTRCTQADMLELEGIAMGWQKTTINSNVKAVLDYCKVKTIAEGIGWRVTR